MLHTEATCVIELLTHFVHNFPVFQSTGNECLECVQLISRTLWSLIQVCMDESQITQNNLKAKAIRQLLAGFIECLHEGRRG